MFLEKFFTGISKLRDLLLRKNSFEFMLQHALATLEESNINEIKHFIRSRLTDEGGFSGRDPRPDLYYSLFGYYLCESLSMREEIDSMKEYIRKMANSDLKGVHLYCALILNYKLFGKDQTTKRLKKQILKELYTGAEQQIEYKTFLGLFALYYLRDWRNIRHFIKKNLSKMHRDDTILPTSVTAARMILLTLDGQDVDKEIDDLNACYTKNGGFKATLKAPVEDILSTSVALFALNFVKYSLVKITPDVLMFIDQHYENGSFKATGLDKEGDIEYTFYGMLALGTLNS